MQEHAESATSNAHSSPHFPATPVTSKKTTRRHPIHPADTLSPPSCVKTPPTPSAPQPKPSPAITVAEKAKRARKKTQSTHGRGQIVQEGGGAEEGRRGKGMCRSGQRAQGGKCEDRWQCRQVSSLAQPSRLPPPCPADASQHAQIELTVCCPYRHQ